MKTENRGGARQGAGRPKVEEPAKTRTIKLTDADWERFKSIGGAKWLRIQLATEKRHVD